MNFNGCCLINNICIPKKVIHLHIYGILGSWLKNWKTDFTLNSCLHGSVIKNSDLDKYKYSTYDIAFDSFSEFHLQMEAWEKAVIILGDDICTYW